MEIFPDEYIHFGADEIIFHANCSLESKINSLFGLHAPCAIIVAYALAPKLPTQLLQFYQICKIFTMQNVFLLKARPHTCPRCQV